MRSSWFWITETTEVVGHCGLVLHNLLLWRCLVAMEVMSYLQKRYKNKRNQSSCVEKISSYNSYGKKTIL